MLRTVLSKTTAIIGICLIALGVFVPAATVRAEYPGGDKDTNAVIYGGVNNDAEARHHYRNNGFVKTVYTHFSIKSEADLAGMVRGRVTKTGEIWVGNERLATGAVTAGRIKMGADEVQVPGANAWMRPPSRSFRSNSLEALVKLNSRGEFMHGVIMACGNPVQAAHKKPKPPKPTPPSPQPPKKPNLEITKQVRVSENGPWEAETAEANPGAAIEYRILVTNTGETELKDVRIHDTLPGGVSFEGQSILQGSPQVTDKTIGDLLGDGITIPSLARGATLEIRFSVTVEATEVAAGECEQLRNIARAKAKDVPEKEADVLVTVCKPEVPPEQPPQVQGATTPQLPVTGAAGALGIFSVSSLLGVAAYKLKEFFLTILR